MSVRMRMTKSKTGNRRAHHGATAPRVVRDKETGQLGRRHFMSPDGTYRGRVVKKSAVKAVAKKAEVVNDAKEKATKKVTKKTEKKTEKKATKSEK